MWKQTTAPDGSLRVVNTLTGRVIVPVAESNFSRAEKADMRFAIARVDEKLHRAWGWFYITRDKDGNQIVDKKNAICPTDVLEDAVYRFNRRASRPSTDMHERSSDGTMPIPQGWIIESMMFTREKCAALGIPEGTLPEGWFGGVEMPESSSQWQAIARGERDDFSIAGFAESEYL